MSGMGSRNFQNLFSTLYNIYFSHQDRLSRFRENFFFDFSKFDYNFCKKFLSELILGVNSSCSGTLAIWIKSERGHPDHAYPTAFVVTLKKKLKIKIRLKFKGLYHYIKNYLGLLHSRTKFEPDNSKFAQFIENFQKIQNLKKFERFNRF